MLYVTWLRYATEKSWRNSNFIPLLQVPRGAPVHPDPGRCRCEFRCKHLRNNYSFPCSSGSLTQNLQQVILYPKLLINQAVMCSKSFTNTSMHRSTWDNSSFAESDTLNQSDGLSGRGSIARGECYNLTSGQSLFHSYTPEVVALPFVLYPNTLAYLGKTLKFSTNFYLSPLLW